MQQPKDQQISPRQRNCLLHQCFFWLYHAAVIGLGLAILAKIVLSFQILQQIKSSPQILHAKQTTWLWQKGPIIDIKSVNTNNCPEGYNPLLSYNWTGTTNGCYCQAVVQNRGLQYGLCTSQLISQGCKQISAMDEQTLRMWKGGKLICIKRAQGVSFYDSVKSTTQQGITLATCANNKTYQFNTLPNVTCPISQVSNTTLPSSTKIPLSSTQSLYYTTQSNYPIADFKISQHSFCQFLNEINISPNKIGNYKLQVSQYQPCQGVDTRYKQFDVLNQEDFYTNNTRVYDRILQLPGYPRPSTNYVFKLGYIRYPEWTYACRTSPAYNLHTASEHLLFTKQSSSIQTVYYVSIPCIIAFTILFRILFTIRHVIQLRQRMLYNAVFLTQNEIQQQLPNLNIKHSKIREVVIFFLQQVLKIAVIVVVIIALLTMFNTSVWIKDAIRMKCTQTFVDELFLYYEQRVDSISEILVQVCFIWAVMFIVDMIWLITRFKYTDLAYKSSTSQQQSQINMPSQQQQLHQINNQKLKQLQLPQQSSQIILDKNRNYSMKINDIDDYMLADDRMFNNAGQTKGGNFYNSGDIQNSDYNLISNSGTANKKRKKKQVIKKKKNLFKGDN